MALSLSKDEREKLKADLAAAKPYSANEMLVLDGEADLLRSKATIAQKLLGMNDGNGKGDK